MSEERLRRRRGPVIKKCHDGRAFWEPLHLLDAQRCTTIRVFGRVACCAHPQCFKPVSDVELDGAPPQGYGESSWALMMTHHPKPPFNFKTMGASIVPHVYEGQSDPKEPRTTSAAAIAAAAEEPEIMDGREEFS